ncbi:hypothetical protein TNCV_1896531 [Trichonephila clavipes]|nr:hypothetical protein TNCV_1896531 [Trichonephila clavipes]
MHVRSVEILSPPVGVVWKPAPRGLLATDLVLSNQGQAMRMTLEPALLCPNYHITLMGERLSLRALTRRVFRGTMLNHDKLATSPLS